MSSIEWEGGTTSDNVTPTVVLFSTKRSPPKCLFSSSVPHVIPIQSTSLLEHYSSAFTHVYPRYSMSNSRFMIGILQSIIGFNPNKYDELNKLHISTTKMKHHHASHSPHSQNSWAQSRLDPMSYSMHPHDQDPPLQSTSSRRSVFSRLCPPFSTRRNDDDSDNDIFTDSPSSSRSASVSHFSTVSQLQTFQREHNMAALTQAVLTNPIAPPMMTPSFSTSGIYGPGIRSVGLLSSVSNTAHILSKTGHRPGTEGEAGSMESPLDNSSQSTFDLFTSPLYQLENQDPFLTQTGFLMVSSQNPWTTLAPYLSTQHERRLATLYAFHQKSNPALPLLEPYFAHIFSKCPSYIEKSDGRNATSPKIMAPRILKSHSSHNERQVAFVQRKLRIIDSLSQYCNFDETLLQEYEQYCTSAAMRYDSMGDTEPTNGEDNHSSAPHDCSTHHQFHPNNPWHHPYCSQKEDHVDPSRVLPIELDMNNLPTLDQIDRVYHKESVLGCQHYERSVHISATCCGLFYPCRYCHDLAQDHAIVRKDISKVVCMYCILDLIEAECTLFHAKSSIASSTESIFSKDKDGLVAISHLLQQEYPGEVSIMSSILTKLTELIARAHNYHTFKTSPKLFQHHLARNFPSSATSKRNGGAEPSSTSSLGRSMRHRDPLDLAKQPHSTSHQQISTFRSKVLAPSQLQRQRQLDKGKPRNPPIEQDIPLKNQFHPNVVETEVQLEQDTSFDMELTPVHSTYRYTNPTKAKSTRQSCEDPLQYDCEHLLHSMQKLSPKSSLNRVTAITDLGSNQNSQSNGVMTRNMKETRNLEQYYNNLAESQDVITFSLKMAKDCLEYISTLPGTTDSSSFYAELLHHIDMAKPKHVNPPPSPTSLASESTDEPTAPAKPDKSTWDSSNSGYSQEALNHMSSFFLQRLSYYLMLSQMIVRPLLKLIDDIANYLNLLFHSNAHTAQFNITDHTVSNENHSSYFPPFSASSSPKTTCLPPNISPSMYSNHILSWLQGEHKTLNDLRDFLHYIDMHIQEYMISVASKCDYNAGSIDDKALLIGLRTILSRDSSHHILKGSTPDLDREQTASVAIASECTSADSTKLSPRQSIKVVSTPHQARCPSEHEDAPSTAPEPAIHLSESQETLIQSLYDEAQDAMDDYLHHTLHDDSSILSDSDQEYIQALLREKPHLKKLLPSVCISTLAPEDLLKYDLLFLSTQHRYTLELSQHPNQSCVTCTRVFARVYCDSCRLYDDKRGKQVTHCPQCKICRSGASHLLVHCNTCGVCYNSKTLKDWFCQGRSGNVYERESIIQRRIGRICASIGLCFENETDMEEVMNFPPERREAILKKQYSLIRENLQYWPKSFINEDLLEKYAPLYDPSTFINEKSLSGRYRRRFNRTKHRHPAEKENLTQNAGVTPHPSALRKSKAPSHRQKMRKTSDYCFDLDDEDIAKVSKASSKKDPLNSDPASGNTCAPTNPSEYLETLSMASGNGADMNQSLFSSQHLPSGANNDYHTSRLRFDSMNDDDEHHDAPHSQSSIDQYDLNPTGIDEDISSQESSCSDHEDDTEDGDSYDMQENSNYPLKHPLQSPAYHNRTKEQAHDGNGITVSPGGTIKFDDTLLATDPGKIRVGIDGKPFILPTNLTAEMTKQFVEIDDGLCYPHICIPDIMMNPCMICYDDLSFSNATISTLSCGHLMHSHPCYQSAIKAGVQKCPLCKRSLVKSDAYDDQVTRFLEMNPMPPEYNSVYCKIQCNDCLKSSEVKFHQNFMRCPNCTSYNTCFQDYTTPLPSFLLS